MPRWHSPSTQDEHVPGQCLTNIPKHASMMHLPGHSASRRLRHEPSNRITACSSPVQPAASDQGPAFQGWCLQRSRECLLPSNLTYSLACLHQQPLTEVGAIAPADNTVDRHAMKLRPPLGALRRPVVPAIRLPASSTSESLQHVLMALQLH